jgi:hypothetical protein
MSIHQSYNTVVTGYSHTFLTGNRTGGKYLYGAKHINENYLKKRFYFQFNLPLYDGNTKVMTHAFGYNH